MAVRRYLTRLVASAAALAVLSPACALDLSGEKVTILVPFGEGGGSDTLARFLQPYLKEALPGHPNVVVLNKPGGGSVTGVNGWVGSAKTDGTDILVGSTSTWVPFVFGSETVKYDPNDMRPVVGFPRLGVFYTNPERTKVTGASSAEGVEKLRSTRILKGANAPRFGPDDRTYQVMHYLRPNLAKSIMLPPGTPEDVVDAHVAAFKTLEDDPACVDGMTNQIQARSFVYCDDMGAAFRGASARPRARCPAVPGGGRGGRQRRIPR
ncbi:hypothetical protein LA6_005750 (plasmid) [Paracoccaceae bacterium]|nr:hypothetical protein LA6_005750 [Paracoccaceae bacterium]